VISKFIVPFSHHDISICVSREKSTLRRSYFPYGRKRNNIYARTIETARILGVNNASLNVCYVTCAVFPLKETFFCCNIYGRWLQSHK